jgi:hypothetical protein
VILALGRQGATWKSGKVSGRRFLEEKEDSFSGEISCLGILFEYHVESWKTKIAN